MSLSEIIWHRIERIQHLRRKRREKLLQCVLNCAVRLRLLENICSGWRHTDAATDCWCDSKHTCGNCITVIWNDVSDYIGPGTIRKYIWIHWPVHVQETNTTSNRRSCSFVLVVCLQAARQTNPQPEPSLCLNLVNWFTSRWRRFPSSGSCSRSQLTFSLYNVNVLFF